MTISDRRLDRIWRRRVAPVMSAVEGWDQVTPHDPDSTWIAAESGPAQLLDRDPDRLGADLEALWSANGREVLLPLAPVMQKLAARMTPEEKNVSREVSSVIYEMH